MLKVLVLLVCLTAALSCSSGKVTISAQPRNTQYSYNDLSKAFMVYADGAYSIAMRGELSQGYLSSEVETGNLRLLAFSSQRRSIYMKDKSKDLLQIHMNGKSEIIYDSLPKGNCILSSESPDSSAMLLVFDSVGSRGAKTLIAVIVNQNNKKCMLFPLPTSYPIVEAHWVNNAMVALVPLVDEQVVLLDLAQGSSSIGLDIVVQTAMSLSGGRLLVGGQEGEVRVIDTNTKTVKSGEDLSQKIIRMRQSDGRGLFWIVGGEGRLDHEVSFASIRNSVTLAEIARLDADVVIQDVIPLAGDEALCFGLRGNILKIQRSGGTLSITGKQVVNYEKGPFDIGNGFFATKSGRTFLVVDGRSLQGRTISPPARADHEPFGQRSRS